MYSFLLTPRWIAALGVTAVVVIVFVMLGNWQLDRHEEVRLENEVRAARLAAEPLPIEDMVASAGDDVGSLAFRRATATGVFEAEREIFVRNEVDDGQAGFHVITPLETEAGTLLVNRGWVPLAAERPPVSQAPPPGGDRPEAPVEVEVLVQPSEERPALGRVEPEGRLEIVNRIDLDRLSQQFDDLLPVWGQLIADTEGLPRPVELPAVTDDGPHLEYALQWYAFAAITIVGATFLIRSSARKTGKADR